MKKSAPQPHILLIDDDELFRTTLARSLQRKGLNVSDACGENDAIALVNRFPFELILLDLNLNGESGLQLLEKILCIEPDTCVVLLTAYASVATAVDAIKRGAEDYLCKPITASDIMRLLQKKNVLTEKIPINLNPLSIEQLEWEHLQRVLMENEGNISATARVLNMHRRTLQRKLQKRPTQQLPIPTL